MFTNTFYSNRVTTSTQDRDI